MGAGPTSPGAPAARRSRRCLASAGALLAALLLGACAHYQPAPIDPARSAAEFGARKLDDAALGDAVRRLTGRSTPWPPGAWDRADLLAVAMLRSPKLAVARAEAAEALAREALAGRRANPELTLQSEYARHDPHPWLYGLGLDLLLESGERRRLANRAAQLDTSAARFLLMDAAWSVRGDLLDALSRREGAARRGALLQRLADAQQKLVELERRRVDAGEEAPEQWLVASQARLETAQQVAAARAEAAQADAALAVALGMPAAAVDGAKIDWTDWGAPAPLADGATRAGREQALRARSDLAAAIDAYAAAEARLQHAVLQQYPQVHLSPGYAWDHGIVKLPLDASFELPLFHHAEGEIAEATAARELAGARLLERQATIFGEIDAAGRDEQNARDALDSASQALQSARELRRRSAVSLQVGAIAANEDLATEVLALRAGLEVERQRERLQLARNALEQALRAPLSGPELDLPQPLPAAGESAR